MAWPQEPSPKTAASAATFQIRTALPPKALFSTGLQPIKLCVYFLSRPSYYDYPTPTAIIRQLYSTLTFLCSIQDCFGHAQNWLMMSKTIYALPVHIAIFADPTAY